MRFLRQIGMEIKNILRSKFMLIVSILVICVAIVVPVITALTPAPDTGGGGPIVYREAGSYPIDKPIYPGGEYNGEPIVIDGVTIEPENPFYWNVSSLMSEQANMNSSYFTVPETVDLMQALIGEEINMYVRAASQITTYNDYRAQLMWSAANSLYDKFLYDHVGTANVEALKEVAMYRKGMDPDTFMKTFVDITAAERLAAMDKADSYLTRLFNVIDNNDFAEYIALSIEQEQVNIASLEDQIAVQEQAIIDNPSQEEQLNQYIEQLRQQIDLIETNTIPLLEYRLEKNIVPGDGSWQNTALDEITNCRNEITYTVPVSEEEFNQQTYLVEQYGSYVRYVAAIQNQLDALNTRVLVAQHSLDSNQPDMKFVMNGARMKTTLFLGYSVLISLFGVLIGGWLMASEFQQGTIRLLMIRPRTRTKILMAKFTGGLLICLAVYAVSTIVNVVANGVCLGFSDFGFPNYTASGEIGFLGFFLPRMLACAVPIVFAYCMAFMMSTLTKNIAVSIAVPMAFMVAGLIFQTFMYYGAVSRWIVWTPLPYIQISNFFTYVYSNPYMTQTLTGFQLGYGIGLLLVLGAAGIVASLWVFRRRDITN